MTSNSIVALAPVTSLGVDGLVSTSGNATCLGSITMPFDTTGLTGFLHFELTYMWQYNGNGTLGGDADVQAFVSTWGSPANNTNVAAPTDWLAQATVVNINYTTNMQFASPTVIHSLKLPIEVSSTLNQETTLYFYLGKFGGQWIWPKGLSPQVKVTYDPNFMS